jgi:hypothetical protein
LSPSCKFSGVIGFARASFTRAPACFNLSAASSKCLMSAIVPSYEQARLIKHECEPYTSGWFALLPSHGQNLQLFISVLFFNSIPGCRNLSSLFTYNRRRSAVNIGEGRVRCSGYTRGGKVPSLRSPPVGIFSQRDQHLRDAWPSGRLRRCTTVNIDCTSVNTFVLLRPTGILRVRYQRG